MGMAWLCLGKTMGFPSSANRLTVVIKGPFLPERAHTIQWERRWLGIETVR